MMLHRCPHPTPLPIPIVQYMLDIFWNEDGRRVRVMQKVTRAYHYNTALP